MTADTAEYWFRKYVREQRALEDAVKQRNDEIAQLIAERDAAVAFLRHIPGSLHPRYQTWRKDIDTFLASLSSTPSMTQEEQ